MDMIFLNQGKQLCCFLWTVLSLAEFVLWLLNIKFMTIFVSLIKLYLDILIGSVQFFCFPKWFTICILFFFSYFSSIWMPSFSFKYNVCLNMPLKINTSDRGWNPGPFAYRASALLTELSGCLTHYLPYGN